MSFFSRYSGTPTDPCLTTTPSAPMASRVHTVSLSVSPLLALEPEDDQLITSADRIFPASSKEDLVLVEFSKKQFIITFPRSAGAFFIGRSISSSI